MLLQRFYNDEHTREAVKEFLLASLKEKTIELAFAGKETNHIVVAKTLIDEAWYKLDNLYGKEKQKEKENYAR